ncbi:MAG: hypothetical protein ACLQVF_40920 [Isosphaeraceae bacterium]
MRLRDVMVHLEAIRKAVEGRQQVAWGVSPRKSAGAPSTVPLEALRKAPEGRQNVAWGVSTRISVDAHTTAPRAPAGRRKSPEASLGCCRRSGAFWKGRCRGCLFLGLTPQAAL